MQNEKMNGVTEGQGGPPAVIDELLCVTLRNGVKIPKLGFWTAVSKNIAKDVTQALLSGYRHLVLDFKTDNDKLFGDSVIAWLKSSRTYRNELFISVMVDISQPSGLGNARQSALQRLKTSGCQYFDMVILHKSDTKSMGDNLRQRNAFLSLWRSLEKFMSDKVARCLSLSNFRQEEVEAIVTSCQVPPSALWFVDPPSRLDWEDLWRTRGYCQYREMHMGVLPRVDRPEPEWVRCNGPTLGPVAKRLGHTPLQVFQRFHIQKNILVSIATDGKTIDSSFKVFDFHLAKDDISDLEPLSL